MQLAHAHLTHSSMTLSPRTRDKALMVFEPYLTKSGKVLQRQRKQVPGSLTRVREGASTRLRTRFPDPISGRGWHGDYIKTLCVSLAPRTRLRALDTYNTTTSVLNRTNENIVMLVNENGNVGIGTTNSDGFKLNVNGSLKNHYLLMTMVLILLMFLIQLLQKNLQIFKVIGFRYK
jgi:hypothetical protein